MLKVKSFGFYSVRKPRVSTWGKIFRVHTGFKPRVNFLTEFTFGL